jgi:Flp pilus assembly protein TadG
MTIAVHVTGTVTGRAALSSGGQHTMNLDHREPRMSRPSQPPRARLRGRGERARAGRHDHERGSITLMLAALSVALIALAGIVIDGGAKLRAAENADAVAQEAARAGAGIVNQSTAYSTGTFIVDQSQAIAAARAYLAAAANAYQPVGGLHGTVAAHGRDSIRVTVTVSEPTSVLSIIGIDSMSSTGAATAALVTGVTGPGA